MAYSVEDKARAQLIAFAEEPSTEVDVHHPFNVKQAAMLLTRKPHTSREELLRLRCLSQQRTSNLLVFKNCRRREEAEFSLPQLAEKKLQRQRQLGQIYHRLPPPKHKQKQKPRIDRRKKLINIHSPPTSCVLLNEPQDFNQDNAQQELARLSFTKVFIPRFGIKRRTILENMHHNRSASHHHYDY